MGQIIKFACLVGLRPAEVVESVRLLNNNNNNLLPATDYYYYNAKRQALEHFRFPSVFLRQTKNAYISFVTPEMMMLAIITVQQSDNEAIPSYNAIRLTCRRKGIYMDMRLCRKVFASWLHRCGISDIMIDLLQGRTGKSVLVNHYIKLSQDYKEQILGALNGLKKELELESSRQ
jgi:intergrase/recombinase